MNASSNSTAAAAEAIINLDDTILFPARQKNAGVVMDYAIDKLRTAHLALCPEIADRLSEVEAVAVWTTIEQAISELVLVRKFLHRLEGGAS